ncbi:hypothetical protein AVEN_100315-1 [Araneus ventricosus]|uniref:Uncharacterized protein n=1 Tax=Araneus ventricosus TaxID=182803 RepID=A0A4Y2UYY0_ARAVE|nr:hypothetical protein AVEN_100315-1 [Araneus ventricosus]
MPPKKRVSFHKSSVGKKRKTKKSETEEISRRKRTDAERMAFRRQRANFDESQASAERMAVRRQRETSEERQVRLQADAESRRTAFLMANCM